MLGGCSPKKTKKASRYTKIGKIGIGFGHNSKLETVFFFFFVFLFLLVFWLRLWPTFEIGNWYLDFFWVFWIFWDFLVFLAFDFRVRMPSQKTKKTSRYTKIGKLACFFFLVFFGVSTPPPHVNR